MTMERLKELFESGKINKFFLDLFRKTPGLIDDELLNDAEIATKVGVKTPDDYKLFHYIDHYTDDLVQEIIGAPLSEEQQNSLKAFMFSLRDQLDFGNLVSFRAAVLKWLKHNKDLLAPAIAYPNKGRVLLQLKQPDIMRWAELAAHVKKATAAGHPEGTVLLDVAHYLPEPERLDFLAWYRFRYGNNRELYDVDLKIKRDSEGTMSTRPVKKQALFQENQSKYYLPDFKSPYLDPEPIQPLQPEDAIKKKERNDQFQAARSKLVARTFAIDKLLEKYRELFSDEQFVALEDALNNLRKRIRLLAMAESVNDSFLKTAGQLERKGFSVGAFALRALAAEEFGGGFVKTAREIDTAELQKVLNQLYELSNYLKRRDVVRQLASIDLKLHDMMLSSFFPEISEAMSKLIDAMGYAANKLEDAMPKIRTSVTNPQDKGPPQLEQVQTPPQEAELAGRPAPAAPASTPAEPAAPAEGTPPVSNLERELAKT